MGELSSDNHYIYYCGQESLRRNRVALIVNKRVRNAVLRCNLKNDSIDLCSFPRQTIQYHSNPGMPEPVINTEKAEVERFYEDLQDLLELIPKQDVQVGSQEISRVTGKFGLGVQNEAGQRLTEFLPRECTGHRNTLFQQHKR